MQRYLYRTGLALLLGISLLGCQQQDILIEKKLPASCWAYGDSLAFSFQPRGDTLGLRIALELEDAYNYSNLYLRLQVRFPSGRDTLIRRTQTFIDPLGNWQVERQSGRYHIPFDDFAGFPTPEQGVYQFTLRQDMREDTLCGVRKVGIASGE